jgi:hypothetical protein
VEEDGQRQLHLLSRLLREKLGLRKLKGRELDDGLDPGYKSMDWIRD